MSTYPLMVSQVKYVPVLLVASSWLVIDFLLFLFIAINQGPWLELGIAPPVFRLVALASVQTNL